MRKAKNDMKIRICQYLLERKILKKKEKWGKEAKE